MIFASSSVPRVAFVHAPLDGPASGGTRYNRKILREAARAGRPLLSLPWSGDASEPPALGTMPLDAVLWDSLFLPWLADPTAWRTEVRHGLLAHYLPFENPLLHAAERRAWHSRFQRVAGRMSFFIATGRGVSRRLAQDLPGIPVTLAEPGVDPEFHAADWPIPHRRAVDPVRLITVANLLPAKRPLELLELLAAGDADWRWLVVGEVGLDPNYAGRFRDCVESLGLSDRVALDGSPMTTPELARALAASDIFLNYSAYESYGMALAEAAAIGLPIVTTRVGEAARLVEDGVTGRVIGVNRPDEFRRALEGLIRDRDLRRRCHAIARSRLPRAWPDTFARISRYLFSEMPAGAAPVPGQRRPSPRHSAPNQESCSETPGQAGHSPSRTTHEKPAGPCKGDGE
jgi:glycosyltransferase involved in cell wall biosynthesis